MDYYSLYKSKPIDEDEFREMLYIYKESGSRCPLDPKDKLVKMKDDNGDLVMQCTSKDWRVKISLSKRINLYKKIDELQKDRQKAFFAMKAMINEGDADGNLFNSLKEEYEEKSREISGIKQIFKEQNEKIGQLNDQKTEFYKNSVQLGIRRKNLYSRIKSLEITHKNQLRDVYKKEGMPKDTRLKGLAAGMKVSLDDVTNYIKWLDASKKYVENQYGVTDIVRQINELKSNFTRRNESLIVEAPKVVQEKAIKLETPPLVPEQPTSTIVKEPATTKKIKKEKSDKPQIKRIKILPPTDDKRVVVREDPTVEDEAMTDNIQVKVIKKR